MAAAEGEVYTLTGYAWTHHDDPLVATHTYGVLTIKFFDDSYNFLGGFDSNPITSETPTDTWTELTVSATTPAGATKVQACVEFWQCKADASGGNCWDGNGGVYFDAMSFTK
jgi:hypothetical protein